MTPELKLKMEELASAYVKTCANTPAHMAYEDGFKAALKLVSEMELDQGELNKIVRKNARNACCPANEVDSDVDYYIDSAKADGIYTGARWAWAEFKRRLG
jgi:hypothetical protein